MAAGHPLPEGMTLEHNEEASRYELRKGQDLISLAAYLTANGVRYFNHTVTTPGHGGHGNAALVVRFALDDTVAQGLKIVPACSYVQELLIEHRDWDDSIDRTA